MTPTHPLHVLLLGLATLTGPVWGMNPKQAICRDALLAAQPTPYAPYELKLTPQHGSLATQRRRIEGRMELAFQEPALAFGPNARWIYSLQCTAESCFVRRWAAHSREVDPQFLIKVSSLSTAIAASVNGTEVAVAAGSLLYRYSTEGGGLIATEALPYTFPSVTQLLYTENANHLLIAGENGAVNVRGLGRTRKTSWGFEFNDDYFIVAGSLIPPLKQPSPGRHTLIGGEIATPEMVDEMNSLERATKRTLRPQYVNPVSLGSSPSGMNFTVAYLDGTCSVFNALSGNEVAYLDPEVQIAQTPASYEATANDIYFDAKVIYSADSHYLVTIHKALIGGRVAERQVSLWDAEFMSLIRTTTLKKTSHVVMLEHPAIVHTFDDGSVQINDFARDKKLQAIEGGGGKLGDFRDSVSITGESGALLTDLALNGAGIAAHPGGT